MQRSSVSAILAPFERRPDTLIAVLQAVQHELGYLPPDALATVARHTRVPRSRVYGVASFYAQFRFHPVGRQRVAVCRGTACHVRGARLILEELERTLGIAEGETSEDKEYSLETVACIGCCGLSPCLSVNDEVSAKLTPKKVRRQFRDAKKVSSR
jgi:NADH-quinone oxidoreductase subunit E